MQIQMGSGWLNGQFLLARNDMLIASTNMYTLEPAPPLRCLHSGNLVSNIPRPRQLFVRSYITLTMGKGGGVNGTAGIKTKFDGLSRNSVFFIHGVLWHSPMGIGRDWMDPKDQAGCGEIRTAHPVGPTKCPNNHHPCYGICIRRNSRCNFVLSVQNELLMAINPFSFSFFIPPFFGGGYFLWTVVIQ